MRAPSPSRSSIVSSILQRSHGILGSSGSRRHHREAQPSVTETTFDSLHDFSGEYDCRTPPPPYSANLPFAAPLSASDLAQALRASAAVTSSSAPHLPLRGRTVSAAHDGDDSDDCLDDDNLAWVRIPRKSRRASHSS